MRPFLTKSEIKHAQAARQRAINFRKNHTVHKRCPKCRHQLLKLRGTYGSFIKCTNPDCDYTSSITRKTGEKCPKCGKDLVRRKGKYGYFLGCTGFPQCHYSRKA